MQFRHQSLLKSLRSTCPRAQHPEDRSPLECQKEKLSSGLDPQTGSQGTSFPNPGKLLARQCTASACTATVGWGVTERDQQPGLQGRGLTLLGR